MPSHLTQPCSTLPSATLKVSLNDSHTDSPLLPVSTTVPKYNTMEPGIRVTSDSDSCASRPISLLNVNESTNLVALDGFDEYVNRTNQNVKERIEELSGALEGRSSRAQTHSVVDHVSLICVRLIFELYSLYNTLN
ncbi:unnamed protein product [Protopolystoma xenopodis]|uniref:Uncharacterized protein n=1 Tax=Protopolystoma xenopodis TaxID=117903 RepID=A0A3S5ANQ2_9PLAT|nr:unnamed protein product [Protopolystoma xenopodis]